MVIKVAIRFNLGGGSTFWFLDAAFKKKTFRNDRRKGRHLGLFLIGKII